MQNVISAADLLHILLKTIDMQPIEFKGQNVIFAKDQPEYLPLPAMRMPDGEVYTCWSISDEELLSIIENRCIYLKQLTFNQPLQPILPMANLEDGVIFI
jgi:hypothetical protein